MQSQSTAPNCNRTFLPAKFGGSVNVRSYQSKLSFPTVLPTPESADSTANGTRIEPAYADGMFSCCFGKILYCQSPFKFIQLPRTICGRGYSGNGLFASIFAD